MYRRARQPPTVVGLEIFTRAGDPARFGGSYGGFLAFMALFRKPDLFRRRRRAPPGQPGERLIELGKTKYFETAIYPSSPTASSSPPPGSTSTDGSTELMEEDLR